MSPYPHAALTGLVGVRGRCCAAGSSGRPLWTTMRTLTWRHGYDTKYHKMIPTISHHSQLRYPQKV
jgi:hypothetical protein